MGRHTNDCEDFGMNDGCKRECPVFSRGECELQDTNEKMFNERDADLERKRKTNERAYEIKKSFSGVLGAKREKSSVSNVEYQEYVNQCLVNRIASLEILIEQIIIK